MTDGKLPEWWAVKTKVDVSDAPKGLKRRAKASEIGCGAKNGWISSWQHNLSLDTEIVVSRDDIAFRNGFDEIADEYEDLPHEQVLLWMPTTLSQCEVVLDDLLEVNPDHFSREWLQGGLRSSLVNEESVAIVSNPTSSRKSSGLIIFKRDLTLYDNRASLGVFVRAFHCEGSEVERGALLAAMYSVIRNDVETGYTSLARAGLERTFDVDVYVEDDDDGMYGVYVAMASLALNDAFNGNDDLEYPEWLDMDRFVQHSSGAEPLPSPSSSKPATVVIP